MIIGSKSRAPEADVIFAIYTQIRHVQSNQTNPNLKIYMNATFRIECVIA